MSLLGNLFLETGVAPESYIFYIWLGIFVISIIVEFATSELVSVWFALGSIFALIISVIPGVPYYISIILFFVVSIFCLVLLRPLSKKLLSRNIVKSNVEEIIGKRGVVIKDITDLERGEIKINDVVWTAELADGEGPINKEEIVFVVAINGNKLIVKK